MINGCGPYDLYDPALSGSRSWATTIAWFAVLPMLPFHHLLDVSVGLWRTNSFVFWSHLASNSRPLTLLPWPSSVYFTSIYRASNSQFASSHLCIWTNDLPTLCFGKPIRLLFITCLFSDCHKKHDGLQCVRWHLVYEIFGPRTFQHLNRILEWEYMHFTFVGLYRPNFVFLQSFLSSWHVQGQVYIDQTSLSSIEFA